MSKILPALEKRWPDLPDYHAGLTFSAWQALLSGAADPSAESMNRLVDLFTQHAAEMPALVDSFEITFQAARQEAEQLTGEDWQAILNAQNRLLKAATLTAAQRNNVRPAEKQLISPKIISQLSQKITSINNPQHLLDEILQFTQQMFGYPVINLFLLNSNRQMLTLQNAVWNGKTPAQQALVSIPVRQGLRRYVIESVQAILINDVSKNDDYAAYPGLETVQSLVCLPVAYGQNLVGVLDIASDRPNAFVETDLEILQAIADQIGIAIEKARLQRMQRRYIKEHTLIYDSIVTLGAAIDVEAVLTFMSKKIVEAVEAGACVICQADEKSRTITAIKEYVVDKPGHPRRTWRPLNSPIPVTQDPIGRQILRNSRPFTSRASGEKIFTWQKPNDDSNLRWNMLLALPFETNTQGVGFVEIYDQNRERHFSPDDVKICRILITQTAQALEQTYLIEQTIQRLSELSMLYTMAHKISTSLDLEDVLNGIVISLREAIGCRACCIFLVDETEQQLEIKAADGLKPHWRKMAKLKLGEGAAGIAAAETRTVYMPDTRTDTNFVVFDENVRSLMVVPLQAKGKTIGAINVDDDQPYAFGPTQERLLTIAAAQAGITIENARLFTTVFEEQQQMQTIIQHMADGLLLIDSEGNILTCNAILASMLGLSHAEIVGKNVHDPNLNPNLASITATSTQYARTGVLTREVNIDAPRPRALQVFATSVTGEKKEKFREVRLVHDVTQERELEQIKDDFYSTISHELRTPLFSIQGFAQLMLEDEPLEPEIQREFLDAILRQAQQLSEMVNNLLDLSRFDAGKLQFEKKPVSLIDIIDQTVLKLRGFAHQQQINLIAELPPRLPEIMGDTQRLEQVLTNLIGNAIKFSEIGQNVLVTALLNSTDILVQVKDQGIGIPAEDLEQIFSRYYQAQNKSERSPMGSGLGLHIAKKIIEEHRGKIWAESEAGAGSTFCFTIPIA